MRGLAHQLWLSWLTHRIQFDLLHWLLRLIFLLSDSIVTFKMPSSKPNDVIIIGAGPVGLALALDLGRRGIRSRIIEKQRNPINGAPLLAKASVINERTMEYCRMLGIADEVANSGYPADLPGDTIFCTGMDGKFIGRLEMASAIERDLPDVCCEKLRRCPQMQFDPILARAVIRQSMADIQYDSEVVSLEQDDGSVTLQVKRGSDGSIEEHRCRYAAACDGAGSRIRKMLGIAFEGKDLGYAISAIVQVDLTSVNPFGRNAERYMFISPEGTWANFTAIDGVNLWRFSIVGGKEKRDLDTVDMKGLLTAALGKGNNIPFEIIRVDQWRRSQFTAETLNKGRVYLAGDSAHTMSPTGGHGLNTGFVDAMTLSWMLQGLIQSWGEPGLSDAYSLERLPVAIRNGQGSTRNFGNWTDTTGIDLVLEEGPEADMQRQQLGLRMATNMRQEFQALGLALGYNCYSSPIVVRDNSTPPQDEPDVCVQTSRPGHRAPHIWLSESKSTLDLFGGGFVLLQFSDFVGGDVARFTKAASVIGLPFRVMNIQDEVVKRVYDAHKLVLVRPDGLVAWRGQTVPEDVGAVLDVVRGCQ